MIVRLYDAKRMQSSTALAFKVDGHIDIVTDETYNESVIVSENDYHLDVEWTNRADDHDKHVVEKLWHDISEEPADRSQCLVISKQQTKDVVTYSGQFFYKGHVVAEPCKMYTMADIVKWAYIEDLIPKED